MARRRRRREENRRFNPQLAALFAVGIMIVSSLAYAIFSKPPSESPPPAASPAEGAPPVFTTDTDGDGIPDTLEMEIGTDPGVRDTRQSLEERRSQIYAAYARGEISGEEYNTLSMRLKQAEALLR
ncbi:MAG: hypothetical protein GXO66_05570 [Euryarchaeota archaeon]|nr:hypothetical protein [Euryarchaeota archaeon]